MLQRSVAERPLTTLGPDPGPTELDALGLMFRAGTLAEVSLRPRRDRAEQRSFGTGSQPIPSAQMWNMRNILSGSRRQTTFICSSLREGCHLALCVWIVTSREVRRLLRLTGRCCAFGYTWMRTAAYSPTADPSHGANYHIERHKSGFVIGCQTVSMCCCAHHNIGRTTINSTAAKQYQDQHTSGVSVYFAAPV